MSRELVEASIKAATSDTIARMSDQVIALAERLNLNEKQAGDLTETVVVIVCDALVRAGSLITDIRPEILKKE
jgi:hypothetical protein